MNLRARGLALIATGLLILQVALWQPDASLQKAVYISPSEVLKHFHFGYNEALADGFWIRAIQDIDYCEIQVAKGRCSDITWLYKMLEVVTELAPTFRLPLSVGAIALSVLVGDVEGASRIFAKGVERFPNDWTLSYKAGYHALIEEKDETKAANYFRLAAQRGAPDWVYSLAGGLYQKNQKEQVAQQVLEEMKNSGVDSGIIKRLEQKIQDLKND